MMHLVEGVGVAVRNFVLSLAAVLKQEAAPGIVTLLLVCLLVISVVLFWRTIFARRNAIRWLQKLVVEISAPDQLGETIEALTDRIDSEANNSSRRQVATAWREYKSTLLPYDEDGKIIVRNAVRPSTFFNPDDLGFVAGFWKVAPGLFVSVGLFLTFLGLISALSSMDLTADKVQNSLRDLLTIASAKFIMSLTGLFCSIIFTIILRVGTSQIDSALHSLSAVIEKRLSFISLEDLAIEQLRAIHEQREHFRLIGFELVAELGRPLREELPNAISASISSAMAPLLNQVGQAGSDGMNEMVKGLSARFSDDVGQALGKASESLVKAGDKIAQISDRMDQSSGRVGSEIDSAVNRLTQAVEDLRSGLGATAATTSGAFTQGADHLLSVMNQTLEGIRDNTSAGAKAVSAAAAEMREAANIFRTEIQSASSQSNAAVKEQIGAVGSHAAGAIGSASAAMLEALARSSQEISSQTESFAAKAAHDLFAPIDRISEQLGSMVATLSEGATGMQRLSDGVRAGAEASEKAAGNFRGASQDLVTAVTPIHSANARIETAVTQLRESTQNAADTVVRSSQLTAQSAAQTLAAAQEMIGGHSKSIEASLHAVSLMLAQLKGQGARLDTMDEKLGSAFDQYTNHVATAVDSLFGHVRKMQEELSPALDTLRAIVEQAEQFTPQSRRPK